MLKLIECDKCETLYNFDDSQLVDGSLQVRCIRCQHLFTVTASSTTAITPAEELPISAAITPAALSAADTQEQPTAVNTGAAPTPEVQPIAPPADLPIAPSATTAETATPTEEKPATREFSFSAAEPFSFGSTEENSETTPADMPAPPSQEFSFESITPATSAADTTESDTISQEPDSFAPEELTVDNPTPSSLAPEDNATIESPVTVTPAPAKKKTKQAPPAARKTSKLTIVLLLILLAIAGIYGYLFITMGTTDVMQMIQGVQQQINPAAQQPQGEIRIDTSASYYIDNKSSGQLFIVHGRAINGYKTPRSELLISSTLYEKKGVKLSSQRAYCGNVINKKDLQTLPMDQLNKTMANPFGNALNNVNVAPGQAVSFMIIFNNLPASLNEFSVEAVSSKSAAN